MTDVFTHEDGARCRWSPADRKRYALHPLYPLRECVRAHNEPDVRGMAEVIRLNCADLDTATEVLRTYLLNARGEAIQTYLRDSLPHVLEGAREEAYDRGCEDHQAHGCCLQGELLRGQ